jgi:biotin carboxyl carrier protein
MDYMVKVDDREYPLKVARQADCFIIQIHDRTIRAEVVSTSPDSELAMIVDNHFYKIALRPDGGVIVEEEEYNVEVADEAIYRMTKATPDHGHKKEITITVPMPGLVIEIEAREGAEVSAGQGLVIVEAMKMQNEIKAPRDGIVKKILVRKGQTVNSREPLLVIE